MSVAKPTSWGRKALSRLHVPRMLATFAIVAGTLASPLTVAPAHAVMGDLTCTVDAVLTFTPALTPGSTSGVSVTGNLPICSSPNGAHTTLTSGSLTGSGTATSAPLPNLCNLLLTAPLTVVVTWTTSPPTTSTINLTLSTAALPLGFGGPVTGGVLAGDNVTAVPVVTPNPFPLCVFTGLTTSVKVVSGVFAFN